MSLEHIIANNVLQYLPPRDLLRTVTCSKSMIEHLSHTTVIQTLLFGGLGVRSKQSLEVIINLLREGKIWKPTPLRMLRLCLAKRCEAKSDCPGRPQHVNESWGVYFCWNCIQNTGTEAKPSMSLLTDALKNPRVSKYSRYLLTNDYVRLGGERCGPLATVETLKRLKKAGKTLREFLESPEVLACAPSDPKVGQIIQAYDDRAVFAGEVQQQEDHRKEVARRERRQVKKAKITMVENQLETRLEDKTKADEIGLRLDIQIIKRSNHYKMIIHDIQAAPSKATQRLLEEIAASTRLVFCGIENDVMPLLSNPRSQFELLLVNALTAHARERRLTPTSLLISSANRIVLAMLKQGMYWESVLWCETISDFGFSNNTFSTAVAGLVPRSSFFNVLYRRFAWPLLSPFLDLLPDFRLDSSCAVVDESIDRFWRTLKEATASKQSHVQVQRDLEAAMTKVTANADRLRAAYHTVSETFMASFTAQYEGGLRKHKEYLALEWLTDMEKKAKVLGGRDAHILHARMSSPSYEDTAHLVAGNFPSLLARQSAYLNL